MAINMISIHSLFISPRFILANGSIMFNYEVRMITLSHR